MLSAPRSRVLWGVLAGLLGSASGCARHAPREASPGDAAKGGSPSAPRDAAARLELLGRADLEATLQFAPATASWLGAHGHDEQLDDVRIDAHAREAARLRLLGERLRQIDPAELDAPRRSDRRLLLRRVELGLYELVEARPLERNPIAYVELVSSAIAELLEAEGRTPQERLRAVTARLWRIRPLLDEARRNLRNTTPELSARRAAELAQATRLVLVETLPKVLQVVADAKLLDDFRAASGDAGRALADFSGWLHKDLLPRARGEAALGRERFVARLRVVEGLSLVPETLAAIGERELREARRRYDEAARSVLGGRAGDPLRLIEDDHPRAEELRAQVRATVERLLAFGRERAHLSARSERGPEVVDMPPEAWGYLQLETSGPLAARPRQPVLRVDPVDPRWPEARRQEHLRALNRASITATLVHELLGHHLQAEAARGASSPVGRLALSPAFLEGWAHYVERLAVEQGLAAGDPKLAVLLERARLVRAARLLAAVRLHALGAKLEDAVKLFTDEAGLEEYQARREAERALLDPLVAADAIGMLQLHRLRQDWRAAHPDEDDAAFHAAVLGHGTPPVSELRRILLGEDDSGPSL